MKIQNLSIIFLVIMIPILLVVSYYIQLQIDALTLQKSYDSKLIAATKDAIEAFEINTVEWNSKYSGTSGSRRRDIEASINTFITTLSDGLGVSGINREYIENYIPAILYTLNDGYYIYTPTNSYKTLKDENGVDVIFDENNQRITFPGTKPANGTILYEVKSGVAGEGEYTYENSKGETIKQKFTTNPTNSTAIKIYEHTLLPLISYSEQVNNGKHTVNYSLDNYVKISGDFYFKSGYMNYGGDKTKVLKDRNTSESSYGQEAGHLVYFDTSSSKTNIHKAALHNGSGYNLKYNGNILKPETLTENVTYKSGSTYKTEKFTYIYIEDNQGDKSKLYYTTTLPTGITNNWFTIDNNDKQVFLTDDVSNVTQYVYKRVTLPGLGPNDPNDEVSTENRYISFYQVLNRRFKKSMVRRLE